MMRNSKHTRQQQQQQHRPRLDRRNAVKNIDYDAAESAPPSSSDERSVYKTRSLDLPLSSRTSFRVEGTEGEVDQIFQDLGFVPDDFSISAAAWEASKGLSHSGNLKTASSEPSDLNELVDYFDARVRVSDAEVEDVVDVDSGGFRDEVSEIEVENKLITNGGLGIVGIRQSNLAPAPLITQSSDPGEFRNRVGARINIGNGEEKEVIGLGIVGIRQSNLAPAPLITQTSDPGEIRNRVGARINIGNGEEKEVSENNVRSEVAGNGDWGIRGSRPPLLSPPPVKMPSVVDDSSSTWDIFHAFGPEDAQDLYAVNEVEEYAEVEREEQRNDDVANTRGLGLESRSSSSNGGDSVHSMGESNHTISPSGSFRCSIMSWQKGDFLGSGSFGTVYEGFTDDGFFFAVKEVSLLGQDSQGQQSIYQLEQEISFLRELQHENVVRYLGTDKDNEKLYIFLELVTKGSLAKLYDKYQLRDSQVSAYTRQILSGLNYLHCRNVVHRDIKCANILVDVSGSVKLADFGLAKVTTKLNDIKSCKGTPYWMAPEVVNQRNHGYGRAADIWSLGCTVLEMLTGQIPYSHLEGMQALFRIGRGELPPIPNTLSKDAQDFILKCLQVNPEDRPTAAQLLEHPFVKKPSSSSFPSPATPRYAMHL
ncbi:hypothetical protein ABFX02_14G094800 [Erythranthe guttata]